MSAGEGGVHWPDLNLTVFNDLVLIWVDSPSQKVSPTLFLCEAYAQNVSLLLAFSSVAVPFLQAKNLYPRSILIQVLITIGFAPVVHTVHSRTQLRSRSVLSSEKCQCFSTWGCRVFRGRSILSLPPLLFSFFLQLIASTCPYSHF